MLKLIDADKKYLDQYKDAYIKSLKEVELGNMKKHNMMFLNPDEYDVIQMFNDNRDQSKLPDYYVPSYDYFAVDDDNIGSYKVIENNGGVLENKIENEDKGEKFLTRRYWINK